MYGFVCSVLNDKIKSKIKSIDTIVTLVTRLTFGCLFGKKTNLIVDYLDLLFLIS